jgi:hypothetical protein
MVEQPTFNRLGLGSNPWTLIFINLVKGYYDYKIYYNKT